MGRFVENDIVLKTYRIEKNIGQGAFGEVYLATHTGLNGKRAIKVLLRDEIGMGSSDYDEYRNRFRQESQLMEWFKHPNVVSVYDFQEEDQTLFLIMEYGAGGSLQHRLDRYKSEGKLFTVDETIKIGLDVAQGLAALHEKDVIHRDLKPSNILFDADGIAKVADLGLAQIPGGSSLRSQMSTAKPHPGTPAYMSPEHANSNIYLSPATDVYSLGLILFEMLTGRNYKNVKPGTRLSVINPTIPAWLEDLIARMLDKNVEKRPWDGIDTAEELSKGFKANELISSETKEKALQEEKERIRLEKICLEQVNLKPSNPQETAFYADSLKNKPTTQRSTIPEKNQISPPSNKPLDFRKTINSLKSRKLIIGGLIILGIVCFIIIVSSVQLYKGNEANIARTSAANTVEVLRTQSEMNPTQKPEIPELVPQNMLNPTGISKNKTIPTSTFIPIPCDRADFVADVTIPDNTIIVPGASFVKTWALKNSGTCTWTTGYSLVYANGEQMGGQTSIPFVANVKPGQTINLSISLTAPLAIGTHQGYWRLQNASGGVFGTGTNGDHAFYVKVITNSNTN